MCFRALLAIDFFIRQEEKQILSYTNLKSLYNASTYKEQGRKEKSQLFCWAVYFQYGWLLLQKAQSSIIHWTVFFHHVRSWNRRILAISSRRKFNSVLALIHQETESMGPRCRRELANLGNAGVLRFRKIFQKQLTKTLSIGSGELGISFSTIQKFYHGNMKRESFCKIQIFSNKYVRKIIIVGQAIHSSLFCHKK